MLQWPSVNVRNEKIMEDYRAMCSLNAEVPLAQGPLLVTEQIARVLSSCEAGTEQFHLSSEQQQAPSRIYNVFTPA